MTKTLAAIAAASTLAASTLFAGTATTAQTSSRARVTEQATIPEKGGTVRTVQVLKSGRRLETITCGDFTALDASFQPQAITYAANYGPKGKAHPTATVSGIERITPAVVASCTARPGDHFVGAVRRAMAQNP